MTSPVTILLLDDEPMLRRATTLLLSNRGGSVTAAATPDEAVALAAAHLYDVAILDLSHGGASVAHVAARMRAAGVAPRRVIVVSDTPLEPSDIGEVLQKPYPFDRLLRAVFGAGGRSRTRSGVFPRARPRGRTQPTRSTQRAPRRLTRDARAARVRG